jgi:hypothetical protein
MPVIRSKTLGADWRIENAETQIVNVQNMDKAKKKIDGKCELETERK